jgi:hypothetical protein
VALAGGSARTFAIATAICAASASCFAPSANADPQTTSQAAADPQSADQDEGVAEYDPTRPINSFDLRYRFEDHSTTSRNDRQFLIYRVNSKITLAPDWKLGLRADLPLTANNTVSATNPDGAYQYGVGRPLVQAYIAHILDDRWAFAIGSKMTAPAISGAQFGSGNWDALPGAAVRYMLPEISAGSFFAPQLNYDFSFAQSFPGRNTRNLQFAPELSIALPDSWFAILYPSTDIRVNYGDALSGQTGHLFLPLDFSIGRNITKDILTSLEISVPIVDDYPVYKFKTEARLSIKF